MTATGGSFLAGSTTARHVFTAGDLSADHAAIARTVDEFWAREVEPRLEAIRNHEPGVARRVLREAAALGLTAMQIPEEYGGLALDLSSVMVVVEHLAEDASYLGWHFAHSGIGTLPLVFYGTDAQKARYLPRLATVDMLGAYALTEPQAGTDALAARTRADLTPDGRHYVLNGQKMWITNGGDADLFTVFANVNGEAFTAFLVERDFGVKSGAQEHKMGIVGTSTTALYFDHVLVPVENVLGEVGKGHLVAFNVLNFGRLKMGPLALGGAKKILSVSLAYARDRRAFGASISSFGAIQHKLADAAVRIHAVEAASWRVVGLIEADISDRQARLGETPLLAELHAFEEFAAECAMIKLAASEMLDDVADHGVQIHGGYGYHRDYFVERAYRDARINRIFEGTNEIVRLVIPSLLLKRAARAGLSLIEEGRARLADLPGLATLDPAGDDATIVARARIVALLLLAAADRRFGADLRSHQEVAMSVADVISETFVLESAWLRAQKDAQPGSDALAPMLATVYLRDALPRVARAAEAVLPAVCDAAEARTALAAVRALTTCEPLDVIAVRQRIARRLIETGRYVV